MLSSSERDIISLKNRLQVARVADRAILSSQLPFANVYHHFRKWAKDGGWDNLWTDIFEKYKYKLDMLSIELVGTNTFAKRSGESVSYQSRKRGRTSNMLILTDNWDIPLICSELVSGHHNDAHDLSATVNKMLYDIKCSNICVEELFLNADAGFDVDKSWSFCLANEITVNIVENCRNGFDKGYLFDPVLYENRFVKERTNY